MREGQIFFFFQRHTQNKHQEQQNGNKDRYRGMRGKVSDYKIFNNTLLPYTHTHIYNTHTHTHTHTRTYRRILLHFHRKGTDPKVSSLEKTLLIFHAHKHTTHTTLPRK